LDTGIQTPAQHASAPWTDSASVQAITLFIVARLEDRAQQLQERRPNLNADVTVESLMVRTRRGAHTSVPSMAMTTFLGGKSALQRKASLAQIKSMVPLKRAWSFSSLHCAWVAACQAPGHQFTTALGPEAKGRTWHMLGVGGRRASEKFCFTTRTSAVSLQGCVQAATKSICLSRFTFDEGRCLHRVGTSRGLLLVPIEKLHSYVHFHRARK